MRFQSNQWAVRFVCIAILCLALSNGLAAAHPFTVRVDPVEYRDATPTFRLHYTFPAKHLVYADIEATDVATESALKLLEGPEISRKYDEILETDNAYYSQPFSLVYALPEQPTAADGGWEIEIYWMGCNDQFCFAPQQNRFHFTPPPGAERLEASARIDSPEPSPPPDDDRTTWLDKLHTRPPSRQAGGFIPIDDFLAFLNHGEAHEAAPSSQGRLQAFINNPTDFLARRGLPLTIALILIGGILLNLTPCVLPMIPVNLSIIGAGAANAKRGHGFLLGATYALGISISYGLFGIIVLFSGAIFGSLQASPVFNLAIGALLIILALASFDVWHLDVTRWTGRWGTGTVRAKYTRYALAFFLGLISATLAGACVAPVLLAVLGLSSEIYAQGQPLALAFPFLLGLGMALPWPFAGAGLSVLPKPGNWMVWIKRILGAFILILAAGYLRTAIQLFTASTAPDSGTAGDDLFRAINLQNATPADWEALIAEAVDSGRPILLDFGAIWCKNCRIMEHSTLQDDAVREQLAGLFAIRIQADNLRQPLAKTICAALNVQGFPTYILYPSQLP